ncbi:uncharacterized protein LOC129581572 isoform X2 [Paramacrobiotus metropolitanus]|uniref:uncharacterized protein LOC129581572 isoform X2 n=1 Tax=Paramacrobiotus metropolitanus TaxID=2943436 RepID=UPI002445C864|nr:uncharacterized protein LOC129581572 isoform X2 [Paramacrobiotus metropolitanus]
MDKFEIMNHDIGKVAAEKAFLGNMEERGPQTDRQIDDRKSLSGSLFPGTSSTYFPLDAPDDVHAPSSKSEPELTKAQKVAAAYFPIGAPAAERKARLSMKPSSEPFKGLSKTGGPVEDGWKESGEPSHEGMKQHINMDSINAGGENFPKPINPFAIPGVFPPNAFGQGFPMMVNPYPDAVKWLQMYGSVGGMTGKDRGTGAATDTYIEHSYQFTCTLAKSADDRTRTHLRNFGKTVKTIVKVVGSLEAAFVTLRGCFYALLNAIEYGAYGWNLLSGFPLVRLTIVTFRMFWHYLKVVGRKGPLVGFLALICTYVGRALIPVLKSLLQPLRIKFSMNKTATVRTAYQARNLRELSVEVGEEVVIEEPQAKFLSNERNMIMVRKSKDSAGRSVRGLIPRGAVGPESSR